MNRKSGLATVQLSSDAYLPAFTLHKQNERDQVACHIALNGWQAFERPLPDYLYRVARISPALVIDVGANTGFYSILAASASARNRILAFEPVPGILQMLRENVRRNGLQDRIRLLAYALSSTNGRSNLYIPTQEHGLVETSASLESGFKSAHSSVNLVTVRTLDSLLFRSRLQIQRVSLIKIDVEGHEAAVLAGAKWTIKLHRPVVFIEILPQADLDWLTRFIQVNRFRDICLVEDREIIVRDKVVYDPEGWNHALVPEERVQWFCGL